MSQKASRMLPPGVKQFMLTQQQSQCGLCVMPFSNPSESVVDHIVPRSRGGSDIIFNLRMVHRRCYTDKLGRLDSEATLQFPDPFTWGHFLVDDQNSSPGRDTTTQPAQLFVS